MTTQQLTADHLPTTVEHTITFRRDLGESQMTEETYSEYPEYPEEGEEGYEEEPPSCHRLFIGQDQWSVPSQVAKDGYYAARHVFRQIDAYGVDLPEREGRLPFLPTGNAFARYARQYRPKGLDREEASVWQSFFLLGWYSKVLSVDDKR